MDNLNLFCNTSGLDSIGLTFDVDWAPEFVIQDLVNLLDAYDVYATFFCTHSSRTVDALGNNDRYERAIHPNFHPQSTQGPDPEDIINALKGLFPEATGTRSHRLVQSSPLLDTFKRQELYYDCNLLMFLQPHLRPFYHCNRLLRIPYYFEDDFYALYGCRWDVDALGLRSPGLKIFNFHPIHVYLNSTDLKSYEKIQHEIESIPEAPERRLKSYVSRSIPGTRSLLAALLEMIKREEIRTYTLHQLAEAASKAL